MNISTILKTNLPNTQKLKPISSKHCFSNSIKLKSLTNDVFQRSEAPKIKIPDSLKIYDNIENIKIPLREPNNTKKCADVFSVKVNSPYGTSMFSLFSETGEKLGMAKIINKPDDYVINAMPQNYREKGFVYLDGLYTVNGSKNQSQYKGLGTELLKEVIQYSKKQGNEGRVALMALDGNSSPTPFYFKNGFRFPFEENNIKMQNYLDGKCKDFPDSGFMFLPEENIKI